MILSFITNLFVHQFGINITGYLFYALYGYYIHKYGVSKKIRFLLYVLSIFSVLVIFIGTCYLSMSSGTYVDLLKSYIGVPVLLYSSGLFVFIKYDFIKVMENKSVNKFVSFLDHYTFGIYLIHWFIIQFFMEILNIDITSVVYRFLAPFLIILICVVITYCIRKIPVVKRIIP